MANDKPSLQDVGGDILGAIIDQATKYPDEDFIARAVASAVLGLRVVSPQGDQMIELIRTILNESESNRGKLGGLKRVGKGH